MLGHKTGGRHAGTPNKASTLLREQVESAAGGPLPVVLAEVGRKAMDAGDLPLAASAFAKAAAFVYARPQLPMEEPPVLIPPLVVMDGKADVPDNWPGPVIRIQREIVTAHDATKDADR